MADKPTEYKPTSIPIRYVLSDMLIPFFANGVISNDVSFYREEYYYSRVAHRHSTYGVSRATGKERGEPKLSPAANRLAFRYSYKLLYLLRISFFSITRCTGTTRHHIPSFVAQHCLRTRLEVDCTWLGVWSCLRVCTHLDAEGIVAPHSEQSSVVRNNASGTARPHRWGPGNISTRGQ